MNTAISSMCVLLFIVSRSVLLRFAPLRDSLSLLPTMTKPSYLRVSPMYPLLEHWPAILHVDISFENRHRDDMIHCRSARLISFQEHSIPVCDRYTSYFFGLLKRRFDCSFLQIRCRSSPIVTRTQQVPSCARRSRHFRLFLRTVPSLQHRAQSTFSVPSAVMAMFRSRVILVTWLLVAR